MSSVADIAAVLTKKHQGFLTFATACIAAGGIVLYAKSNMDGYIASIAHTEIEKNTLADEAVASRVKAIEDARAGNTKRIDDFKEDNQKKFDELKAAVGDLSTDLKVLRAELRRR